MDCNTVNVLLVEDSPDDAYLISKALAETKEPQFSVERVSRLFDGLNRLSQGGVDVVLLDLSLPDSHGLDTFSTVHAQSPQVPVVLLTGTDDEELAVEAAKQGAQDYLVKGQFHQQLLARSILYAVERQRLLKQSKQQALENARLYRELESSREEVAVVDGVARILTSTLDIEQVYEQFALEVRKLVDFDRIYITAADRTNEASSARYLFGVTQPEHFQDQGDNSAPEPGRQLPILDCPPQEVTKTDSSNLDGKVTAVDEAAFSSIDVTLISNGRVIGSMGVRSCRANAYGEREHTILERLGSQIAPALENSELYKRLQASIEEMAVVDEVAAIITSTLNIDEVYERFAQEVKRLVDFDRIVISIVDLGAATYTIAYHYGVPMQDRSPGSRVDLKGTPVEKAVLSRRALFRSYTQDPTDESNIRRLKAGLRSAITVPLIVRGKAIGTMTLHHREDDFCGERERVILERLANQIAPAIENARLYQESLHVQEALLDSESRFRQLYDEAPVGYQEMDAEGRITRVNRTELEMLGYAAEDMLGQPARRFIVEEDLNESSFTSNLARPGSPIKECECTFQRKDGNTIDTLVESRALLDEVGNLAGFRCTIQDITERKQTEKRLQETNRLVSIGELAAGVAHEINNPLTSILGFSQILLSESLPTSVNEDLQKIYYSAQRASKIVQNLLSFARKREPERRLIGLVPVLERALELKSFDFRSGNIDVVCHLDENLPATMADEYQMIQVLMNILTNGQQATQEADVAGQLVIRAYQDEGWIRISVSDNGPGIAPENLGKVFQPFFTTKPVGSGTGLGLSICYGIIQQHDGNLWVESTLGEGTTFHIQLPIVESNDEPEMGFTQIKRNSSKIKHLLVVDDEPHIRDLVSRSLGQLRYTVDLAEDGQEAWRKIQRRSYDCIVMDLKMPNMSGQELFGLLQEFQPDLAQKSIFMTGDMVTPQTRAFMDSVGTPTLSKPFELRELCAHIQTVLGA